MKTNAIVRIIIWSVVIILLVGLLLSVVFGRSYLRSARNATAETAIPEPLVAPLTEAGEALRIPADQVTDIEIDWAAGSILIRPADVEEICISESDVSDTNYAMVYRHRDNKLTLEFCEETFMDFIGITTTISKDLRILVPWGWTCNSLEVNAASATLEVNDLTIQEVEIDSASGECWFDKCTVDTLDLDTASGDVQFVGELNILDCEAASASVRAVLGNTPTRMDLDSMSGDLDITLPVDAGFTAKIDALNSDFTSDFPTTQVNGNHVCGNGSCRINVSAMSGNVIIRQAAAATEHAHTEECTTNPDSCPDPTEATCPSEHESRFRQCH